MLFRKQEKNKLRAKGIFSIIFWIAVLVIQIVEFPTAFAQATCGDGICEAGGEENSCICPQDCGTCGGPITNVVCKEFACVNNICLPTYIPNCCGNTTCDENESYGTCSGDCEPTSLELEVVSPKDNQSFFLGEPILIKVDATSSGRNAASTDLNVTGFFGVLRLFNDGKHDDNSFFDKTFANTLIITDVNAGVIDLNILGTFRGIQAFTARKIMIQTMLSSELELEKKFKRGETVIGKGKILKHFSPISIPIVVELFFGEEKIFETTSHSDTNGAFEFRYPSSLIDPLGEWKVNVWGQDENQNTVSIERQFLMLSETAKDELFIKIINKLKPELRRGENLELFVEVRNDQNKLVEKAALILETPYGKKESFKEIEPGIYSTFSLIPSNLPLGEHLFQVVASKETDETSAEGQLSLMQKITGALLEVKLLEPSATYYRIGETIPVLIKVFYSDQQPVIGANAILKFGEKEIVLEQTEEGLYQTEVQASETDFGEVNLLINVTDDLGNQAFVQTKVTIAQRTIFFELLENPLLTLGIFVFLLVASFFVLAPFLKLFSKYSLEEKRKKILQQKEYLQKQYFSQNILDKKAYQERMKEYDSELEKIEEKLRKVVKK